VKVLVTDGLEAVAIERMRAAGHEVVEAKGLQGDALIAGLAGASALLVRGSTKVTADVIAGAPTLRTVVRAGTGLENVDLGAAERGGVVVHNTPAANAVSVAELVFGLLLAFERHLPAAAGDLRAGRWEKTRYAGRELAQRTLGLVGFGRIGREVATRARAFGMEVVAHDPLLTLWPAGFEWAKRGSLDEVIAAADVLSLHLPLSPATRGLVDAAVLARMKPEALLVNAARGGVVDETALHAALTSGRLRGALLDVFAVEPAVGNPLLALPNVIATPHLGASTREAQTRAGLEAAEIVIAELARLASPDRA